MCVRVVSSQVCQVGTGVFEQADRLAFACEGRSAVIGCAHVAATKRLSRARTCGGEAVSAGSAFIATVQVRARNRIIIEAGDAPEREWKIGRGFAVGGKERTVLRRML